MRANRLCLAFLGALPLVGCSSGRDATVTGRVTVDGREAPVGEVTFYPADGDINRPTPRGMIGPDGVYALKTGQKDGLPAGEYKVGVRVLDDLPPQKGTETPVSKQLSPPRYGNPETSGFEFTVKPGPNTIDLQLEGK